MQKTLLRFLGGILGSFLGLILLGIFFLKRKFLSVTQQGRKVRDRATCMCSPDISHEKNPKITSVCIVKGRLGENIATVSKRSEAFTPLWGDSQ